MSAKSPGGDLAVATIIATLKARIESLEAELAAEQERSAGHRADFERERADRMVTTLAQSFQKSRNRSGDSSE